MMNSIPVCDHGVDWVVSIRGSKRLKNFKIKNKLISCRGTSKRNVFVPQCSELRVKVTWVK